MMKIKIKETLLTLYRSLIVILTYTLLFQSMYMCSKFISTFAIKIRTISLFSFWSATCMTLWCYTTCLFKNPGFLNEAGENTTEYEIRVNMCEKCNLPKIKRSHHCSVCKKCVIKMDHHCIWINNCVGLYNQKFFILLNFYALLMCCNCCFVVIFKIITCIKSQHNFKAECVLTKMDLIHIIVNTISSLIFGMIALVMLVDQYCAIKTNTTGIELLKNIKGKTQPFHESLIEVFETPFSYLWLLPVNRKVQKNLSVSANFTQKKNKVI
ncbi:palmitoyltransferase DHHC11, putative [Plasmodium malariae]|uniref:Palmitoyltransferase n=1 Tax=Plasmodium malariae TaxID=5858 RepID=A0A1D3JIY7_PLAMA|nr:palmitoyltransferase DHHC11, putative [Plasmodium malariae]SBT86470.1 palmitoyltransferase DHHC11, putative [Plasmodium malariae]